MLSALGTAIIGIIEHELVKNAPEIEAAVLEQIDNLAKMLFDYVQGHALSSNGDAQAKLTEAPKDE